MFMSGEEVSRLTGEVHLQEYLHHYYGITIQQAKPLGGVLYLQTDQDSYILKRVKKGTKDRWEMLSELNDHVTKKDLFLPAPILTRNKKLFFEGYQNRYVLLPYIDAKPVKLHSLEEWQQISRALAFFHLSTKDFVPRGSFFKLRLKGKWMSYFKIVNRQLELFQLAAKWTTIPAGADLTWLDYATYTRSLMENVLTYYEKIGGDQAYKTAMEEGKVCHGNLHRQNILADHTEQIYFVDWNDIHLDIRSAELAKWLYYAYGKTGSAHLLMEIISSYNEIHPLTEMDYALVYVRLLFPEQLYRVLHAVYGEQKLDIQEAESHIKRAADCEVKKLQLLKKYYEIVTHSVNVKIPHLEWVDQRSG